jgi:hypothetical protein
MRATEVTESSCKKKVIIALTWGIHISPGM